MTDAVTAWCPSRRGVAVAVNGTVVPRSQWDATVLNPGDRVEIVTAAAGG
ncbi:MAG: sulfur carrier protein ThiS [Acidimicrobiales bacterium]